MSRAMPARNQMPAINPYAPPAATLDGAPTLHTAPPLWNPDAAANWSLLLTPAFGSWLHMKNWQALGETSKAVASWRWAITTVVVTCALILVSALMPETTWISSMVRPVSIGLLLSWYFSSAREQARYVRDRFGNDYPRRGWLRPMAAAVLSIVGIFALLFVGVFVVSFAVVRLASG